MLSERGRFRTEAITYGRDGTPVYVEGITIALRGGGQGQITGYVNIRRDISERKRAEEELRRQSGLTETVTRKAADPMFMMDAEGRTTFANPAAEETFGFGQEELLEEVLHDKIHHRRPDGRPYPRSECPIAHSLDEARVLRDHEDVFFRKDGSAVDVSCSYAPVVVDGEVSGAVLVVRDITGRKEAERERLANIVQNSSDFHRDRRPPVADHLPQRGRPAHGRPGRHGGGEEDRGPRLLRARGPGFRGGGAGPRDPGGGALEGELNLRHFRSGEPIPVLWDTFRVDDPQTGAPIGLATVTRDLTETNRQRRGFRWLGRRSEAA